MLAFVEMVKKTVPYEKKANQATAILRLLKDPTARDTRYPSIVVRAKQIAAGTDKVKRKPRAKKVSSTPILDEMKFLELRRSGLQIIAISQSMVGSKFITEGELRYDRVFNGTISADSLHNKAVATHFTCNSKLTELCIKKDGFKKEQHAHQRYPLLLRHGVFQNKLTLAGSYIPYSDADPLTFETSDKVDVPEADGIGNKGEEIVLNQFEKLRYFNGDFKADLQYLSMILTIEGNFRGKLRQYFKDGLFAMNKEKNLDDGTIESIINGVLKSAECIRNDTKSFRFYPATVFPYETRNYITRPCLIDGWYGFKLNDTEYKVEINRQLVISTLKSRDGLATYNTPLCEEITLQLRSTTKDKTTLCAMGFFISVRLHTASYDLNPQSVQDYETVKEMSAQPIHFLGDNAFTVNIPRKIVDPPINAEAGVMFWVGWLRRQLQAVQSDKVDKLKNAKRFFGPIFGGDSEKNEGKFNQENEIVKLCRSHIDDQRKRRGLDPIEGEKLDDEEILKASFLSNQHAGDLSAVDGSKYIITRRWIVFKSFAMAVLSPASNPKFNYVFVWSRDISKKKTTEDGTLVGIIKPYDYSPKAKSFRGDDSASAETIKISDVKGKPVSIYPEYETKINEEKEEAKTNKQEPEKGEDWKEISEKTEVEIFPDIKNKAAPSRLIKDEGRRRILYDPAAGSPRRTKSQFGSETYSSHLPPELELELELL